MFNILLKKPHNSCILQIWDTAGAEKYRSIISSYYRGAHGVLLVYDLCNPNSAESIDYWMNEISINAPRGLPVIIAGNKSDLEVTENIHNCKAIQKTRETIQDVLLKYPEIKNYECSAKTGENIEILFIELTDAMINHQKDVSRENRSSSSRENGSNNEKRSSPFKLQFRPNKNTDESKGCCQHFFK